jgi:hypothetical protein
MITQVITTYSASVDRRPPVPTVCRSRSLVAMGWTRSWLWPFGGRCGLGFLFGAVLLLRRVGLGRVQWYLGRRV